MRIFVFAAVAALLTACNHQQADANRCSGYGFTPGTDAFAGCLQQRDEGRRNAAAIINAQNPYLHP